MTGNLRATGFFLLLVNLMSGVSVLAQEYSVFGEIEMEGSFALTPKGEADNFLESFLGAEANHRLDYEEFSFTARHRVEVDRQEELHHYLYEAYIDYRAAEILSISAGKQRIPWGRGVAFFPTDVLHPSHTREDVEGFTGLSLILNPDMNLQLAGALDFSTPLAGATPEENEDFYRDLKYALYLSLLAGKADLAFSAVYSPEETLRPGFGMSWDIAGFIVTAEGAVEFNNSTEYPDTDLFNFEAPGVFRPYPLVAAGISRNLTPRQMPDLSLMFVTEYLHAGTGYDKKEREEYFNIIGTYLASGKEHPEIEYLGRNYLFALASLELYMRFSLELSAYASLDDQSLSYAATGTLLSIRGMDLSLKGEQIIGGQRSVFGSLKAGEGEYRVTLKSTIYF